MANQKYELDVPVKLHESVFTEFQDLTDTYPGTLTPISQLDEIPDGPYDPSVVLCTLEGILSDFSECTRNGRWYTKEVWEKLLNSDSFKELERTRTLFGESDHPMDIEDRCDIHYNYVSHCVRDVYLDDKDQCVKGKIDVLDTPAGRIIFTFVKYGSILGVSSRGSGDLIAIDSDGNKMIIGENKKGQRVKFDVYGNEHFIQPDDRIEVDPDSYEFYGWDIVHRPSNRRARVKSDNKIKESQAASSRLFNLVENAKADKKSLSWIRKMVESTTVHDKDEILNKINEYVDMLNGSQDECHNCGKCKDAKSETIVNSPEIGDDERAKYESKIAQLQSDIIDLSNRLANQEPKTGVIINESVDEVLVNAITDNIIKRIPSDMVTSSILNRKLSEFSYQLQKKLGSEVENSITRIPVVEPPYKGIEDLITASGVEIVDRIGRLEESMITKVLSKLNEQNDSAKDKLISRLETDLDNAKQLVAEIESERDEILNENERLLKSRSNGKINENRKYLKTRCSMFNLNESEVINNLPDTLENCDFDEIDNTINEVYRNRRSINPIQENQSKPIGRIKANLNESENSQSFSLIDLVRGNMN